jgi:adenylate cyclase
MPRRIGVIGVCVGLALLVAAVRLLAPVPLEVLDRKLLDFRYLVRGPLAPGPDVVIVGIDEASLAEIGRWPWPRARLAELIDRLHDAGVKGIGLDIVLDEPETSLDRSALETALVANPHRTAEDLRRALHAELDDDAKLATALRGAGDVVLAHFFEFGGSPAPQLTDAALPEMTVMLTGGATLDATPGLKHASTVRAPIAALASAAAGSGHINFAPDPDGSYRRVPVGIRAGDRLVPALGLELLRVHLGQGTPRATITPAGVAAARIGDHELPVDGAGQLWLNFLGPPKTIPQVSAAAVLAGRVPAALLAGRIALVGFTAMGFDEVPTPFAAVAPGVELQATVLDNVLQGRALRRPWWLVPLEAATVIGLGALVGAALRWLPGAWGGVGAAALALGYLALTQVLFSSASFAVGGIYAVGGIVLATVGGAVYRSVVEEGEKRKIRDAFQHYVNPEITELIAQEPGRLRLGGERRPITVLFSDIRGFTGMAERLAPETLGELLNQYLEAMTDVVFEHGGLLDKYIGDAVMAFWGAPADAPDHAIRCCDAALDMRAALERLNQGWREAGLPQIQIRIGINTGDAIVGNFGSSRRFSYTAVGDDVNLASRLEQLNNGYGTGVLISAWTRRAIGDGFVCREIDHTVVKGRAQRVTVYELLCRRRDDPDRRIADRAAAYDEALDACRREAWGEAERRLEVLAAADPDDGVVALALARCREGRPVARERSA